MTNDEFSKRIAKADEDVRSAIERRATSIGSNADAVRIFYQHILMLRPGTSWEDIASLLKTWSGLDIAPATIKQYMTDINVGRMKIELSSTARMPTASPAPTAAPSNIQNSRTVPGKTEPGVNDRQSIAPGRDLSDGPPLPGGFTPPPDFPKRKT